MRALLILGPTASGKSALALALAEALDGEIVNADSMQVYRDLRVLTARPSVEEEAKAPHHLYGYVDPSERFSTGRWLSDARPVIEDIRARGKTPIVVGGTGLYFKALTEGLAPAPPADAETRARLASDWEQFGGAALHARLATLDPEAAARIEPGDPVRLLRALEVAESGVTLSELRQQTMTDFADWIGVALKPDRVALYEQINARFEAMLAQGALDEARALAARELDPMLPAMKAHGMPWLAAHFRGEMTLTAAADLSKRDTRRYAKRQFTWIAHQLAGWSILAEAEPGARVDAVRRLMEAKPNPTEGIDRL